MTEIQSIGAGGERIAEVFLRTLGYSILAANVRLGHDEIDIIAKDTRDDVIVFVEVKSRLKKDINYWPSMNMTWEKKRCMRRAARRWIAQQNFDGGFRLDLVCIAGGAVVDHLINVGWHDGEG